MRPLTLCVSRKERTEVICADALEELARRRETLLGRGALLFTDENVLALFGEKIERAMSGVPLFAMKPGERHKNEKTLFSLLGEMERRGLGRDGVLIGLGGGVVGDVGGLAAGLFMRGIAFWSFPTTLLAQVDAALGGKTAIDFAGIKNLVGGFFQPAEIVCDAGFLSTLPKRELLSGLGEIVKHGALSAPLFEKLCQNEKHLLDLSFLQSVAFENLAFKASVVRQDPFEKTGARAALNLGHTTAHAIEAERAYRHGECVLMGLALESRLARKYLSCDEPFLLRLESLCLSALGGGKLRRIADLSLAAALRDKKNRAGKIVPIVPTGLGRFEPLPLPFEEYRQAVREAAAR